MGRLTGESFTGPNSWTGSYATTYDARGQTTSLVETVNGTTYPVSSAYDDAGHVTSETYPDGEVVATGYTAQGWLGSLSTTPSGQGTTTLVDNVAYSGAAGAMSLPTSLGLGNPGPGDVYSVGITYDALGRVTDDKTTNVSSQATLFEEAAGYDKVGNVTSVSTTLPQGTDTQKFCYDEQNRLTFASSKSGSLPCGGTLAAGTLTSAAYQLTFKYGSNNQLTTMAPTGTFSQYVYSGGPLDGASGVSVCTQPGGPSGCQAWNTTYSASYDAAGEMVCRAPTTGDCTTSSPTAQQLGYDNEGRLVSWQNAPSSPTSTASSFYDGEGNRVLQQSTTNGTTTTATYIGSLEEVSTTGSDTTTTAYYYFDGHRVGLSVNGTISYLASDLLGSAEVALNSSGSATASVLYGPYGLGRYADGAMPTDYVFTGQRGDTTTGLDDYGARYYDPVVGQFTSADSDPRGGLNRYAYVHDDPETLTDPSGHMIDCGGGSCHAPPHHNHGSGGLTFWISYYSYTRPDDDLRDPNSHKVPYITYEVEVWHWSNGTTSQSAPWQIGEQWKCDEFCHQQQALDDLHKQANIDAAFAVGFEIVANVFDWLAAGTVGKLERIADIAQGAALLLSYIGQAVGLNSGVYSVLQKLTAGLFYLSGIALSVLSAYRTWGWLAEHAVDAAIFMIQGVVEGVPGLLEDAVFKAFGGAIGAGLTAGASYWWGQFYGVQSQITTEGDLTPAAWCQLYANGTCAQQ